MISTPNALRKSPGISFVVPTHMAEYLGIRNQHGQRGQKDGLNEISSPRVSMKS
jgi:hypothetical protein